MNDQIIAALAAVAERQAAADRAKARAADLHRQSDEAQQAALQAANLLAEAEARLLKAAKAYRVTAPVAPAPPVAPPDRKRRG